MTKNRLKSLTNVELSNYLSAQLNSFFPDKKPVLQAELLNYIDSVEERAFHCFFEIKKKYFTENGITHFNHLQSDQYCMYLYMLSNHIYKIQGDIEIATKIYYLNKILHAVDIYFTAELPAVFLFVHPVGTLIGRAKFSDFFICYQGVTVGCLNDGIFPEFKGEVILYANSTVLGKCVIGKNVCVAANTSIINENIPENTIVLASQSPNKTHINNKGIYQRPPFFYNT